MIKQRWLVGVAGVVGLVAAYFVFDRLDLLRNAERVVGTVTSVSSSNGRCGSRRSKYNCTKYSAQVSFTTLSGKPGTFSVSAGSNRGHGQPTIYARPGVGGSVPTVYDRRDPERVYEDSVFGVWGTPIMLFFFQIAAFFGSLCEPRRKGVPLD